MFTSPVEIYLAALFSAIFMLLLVAIVVISIVKYLNRQKQHIEEVRRLSLEYEQELTKSKLEIRDNTLSEVSRELHDNVGQVLSLVKLYLNRLIIKPQKTDLLSQSTQLLSGAIDDLRDLSRVADQNYITKSSLIDLINRELRLISKAGLIDCQPVVTGQSKRLKPRRQILVFRIVQEALNNALKHSECSHIKVELNYTDQQLEVSVFDNGIGLDQSKLEFGYGIDNIRHRAELLKASLQFVSEINHGTKIELTIPFDDE